MLSCVAVSFEPIVEPIPHAIAGMIFQFLFGDALKFFVVGSEHDDVDVVVPRNETFVSHRAQKRAAYRVPTNVVLFADASDFLNQTDFYVPQFFSLAGDEKTAAHFVLVNVVDENFTVNAVASRWRASPQKFVLFAQQGVLFLQKFVLFGYRIHRDQFFRQ